MNLKALNGYVTRGADTSSGVSGAGQHIGTHLTCVKSFTYTTTRKRGRGSKAGWDKGGDTYIQRLQGWTGQGEAGHEREQKGWLVGIS